MESLALWCGIFGILSSIVAVVVVFLTRKNIIDIIDKDFVELKINELSKKDFIYLDPPYLLGCASYNEQDGWNITREKQL